MTATDMTILMATTTRIRTVSFYCSFKMLMKSNLGSTFTRKGDRETYKPPNGNTGWTRMKNNEE